jgi:glycosyltransferase involved in cell wall biosynthesis
VKVVLACNFPRDEKLGSSRTPIRIGAELGALGVDVRLLFAEDIPAVRNARVAQLTSPLRMAAALAGPAAGADVVDIAGFDAGLYARCARLGRRAQAVVCRSNGLWYRALAADDDVRQPSARRGLSSLYQRHVLCRWERTSFRAADLAVFLSRADADEIVRQGIKAPEAVAAVNPGVDDFFASPVPLDQREHVAFVGTFFHRKGSDVVATVMARLLHARPTLKLSLFGTGVPPAEVKGAFPEEVRARVEVVPSVPSSDLARRLEGFAILLFPTRYEGFGIVVLEAMRAGLVVVTTPTGAGADLVRDGDNGLLVPVGDVEGTERAVARLLDDPTLRARLARTAVEESSTRSWQRAARELIVVYERACALAARRARA